MLTLRVNPPKSCSYVYRHVANIAPLSFLPTRPLGNSSSTADTIRSSPSSGGPDPLGRGRRCVARQSRPSWWRSGSLARTQADELASGSIRRASILCAALSKALRRGGGCLAATRDGGRRWGKERERERERERGYKSTKNVKCHTIFTREKSSTEIIK